LLDSLLQEISAKILRRQTSAEGEVSQEMTSLKVSPDSSGESCIFFVWPLEIVHVIDKDSPLFDLTATDLPKEKFEIIVIMEGTIETSSMTFQARSSYLPKEILWGQRFESMVHYRKENNKYQVNFSAFNSTYEVETPTCSARDLELYFTQKQSQEKKFSLMMINNLNNVGATHMPMLGVSNHYNIEDQDSSSQPPSVINNINHDITSPLLGPEFRSNSVSSSARPVLNTKNSIISMGNNSNSIGGGGSGSVLYNGVGRRHSAKSKIHNSSSNRSSGEGRDRKTTSDSSSEDREDLEITMPVDNGCQASVVKPGFQLGAPM